MEQSFFKQFFVDIAGDQASWYGWKTLSGLHTLRAIYNDHIAEFKEKK